jgi:hypothetical protein
MRHICIFAILAAILASAQQQAPPPKPAKPKATQQKRRETADEKKVREFLGSRIAYAKLLIAYFAKIGRQTIHVEAIDENQQTLDVFSGLIGKPFGRETSNLVSAREVIESADSIAMVKKCRFKKVVIRGTDYAVDYMVP